MKTFANCLNETRITQGYKTVRSFCLEFNFEPILVNRIEMEHVAPPTWFVERLKDSGIFDNYQIDELEELAEIARKTIKVLPVTEEEIIGMMPATAFMSTEKKILFDKLFEDLKLQEENFRKNYNEKDAKF